MAPRTFTQYLLDLHDSGDDGHAHILSAIAVSVKLTAAMVSRGQLALGALAQQGQGEHGALHRGLRRLATRILLEQVAGIEQLAAVSIAGDPSIHPISGSPRGRYLLLFEALHGSVNLCENQTVGLAFSILERPEGVGACAESDFLQPGSRQMAAGIGLYGPSTVLVLTTGRGADRFTLDRDVGNFVLTDARMTIPGLSDSFAINPSDARHWPAPTKRYVDECLRGADGPRGRDFRMRWNASAVIGAFRILVNGGLFMVPDTGRRTGLWGMPLMHNAAPLAFLAEQAGGAATTATQRILDVVPTSLTQRLPIFLGEAGEVARVERYFAEHEQGLDEGASYPLFHNRTLFIEP
ncbi:class 1 fructose-bisphosphatase [Tessaracoccus sp. Z1128]